MNGELLPGLAPDIDAYVRLVSMECPELDGENARCDARREAG